MPGHPFDCDPDERVNLAWRGRVNARDAVREALSLPSNLRGLVVIIREPHKQPAMLSFEQVEELSNSPGFSTSD